MGTHMHTAWCSGMQCVRPVDAPSLRRPAAHTTLWTISCLEPAFPQSKYHDVIDILIDGWWATLFIPVQTFLQLYNSFATGGYVTWIQWSSQSESAHARCISEQLCGLTLESFCSRVAMIWEWSNSRLGSVCRPPWLNPIPRLLARGESEL